MHLYEISKPGTMLKEYYKINKGNTYPQVDDFNNLDFIIYQDKLYYIDSAMKIRDVDLSIDLNSELSNEDISGLLRTVIPLDFCNRTFIILNSLIQNLQTSYHEAVYSYYAYKEYSSNDIMKYTNYIEELHQQKLDEMKPFGTEDVEAGIRPHEYNDLQKRQVNNLLWNSGIKPISIKRHEKFIYTKMFIFSLDNIYKFISVLDKEFPEKEIKSVRQAIDDKFPDLINLRNSIHHLEDRIRGIGQYGKVIAYGLKSTQLNSGVINNCMSGDLFITTLGSGKIGSLEISPETLIEFREYIETVLRKFEWYGSPQIVPNK